MDVLPGAIEVYLKKGDALLFVDGIAHRASARTTPGERRVAIFRYGVSWGSTRLGYEYSDALQDRLTPERRAILQPILPRRPPPVVPKSRPEKAPRSSKRRAGGFDWKELRRRSHRFFLAGLQDQPECAKRRKAKSRPLGRFGGRGWAIVSDLTEAASS